MSNGERRAGNYARNLTGEGRVPRCNNNQICIEIHNRRNGEKPFFFALCAVPPGRQRFLGPVINSNNPLQSMLIYIESNDLPPPLHPTREKKNAKANPLPGDSIYTCRDTPERRVLPIRRKLRAICAQNKIKMDGARRIRKGQPGVLARADARFEWLIFFLLSSLSPSHPHRL